MTPTRAIIRKAGPSDIEAMAELLTVLFSIETDFAVDRKRQERGLALMLENVQGRLLVAEEEGQVVGMCSGQLTISTAEGGPALLVEDVVVREGWRGQGLGRRLLDAIAEWAMERGASRLQLLADGRNPQALGFYRHLGWATTSLICLRRSIRKPPSKESLPRE